LEVGFRKYIMKKSPSLTGVLDPGAWLPRFVIASVASKGELEKTR